MFGSVESEHPGLTNGEIILDRWTDRRHAVAISKIASKLHSPSPFYLLVLSPKTVPQRVEG